jgi:hypothetical protein
MAANHPEQWQQTTQNNGSRPPSIHVSQVSLGEFFKVT